MFLDIWFKSRNMSYKNPEIWEMAREVVIEIHKMSLSLPKSESKKSSLKIYKK
jgi:hypothetical protein